MLKYLYTSKHAVVLLLQPFMFSLVYAADGITVFESNENYHYRIPAITTNNESIPQTLFAFSEKRIKDSNKSCNDSGEVDIVMKTSSDRGLHWSTEVVVAGNRSVSKDIDSYQAFTNPTVLYANNKLHLMFNTHLKEQCANNKNASPKNVFKKGDRKFWHSYSANDGKSWSKPQEIVIPTRLQDRVDMVGPGNGILTEEGRLIFPASGKNLISYDEGNSWIIAATPHGGTEGTIVQLCDGRLMRNDRPGFTNTKYILGKNKPNNRVYSIGNKLGSSWSAWQIMTGITMPVNPWVQASLVKIGCSNSNQTKLAFSTPNHPKSREKMSIFISEDSGVTWLKKYQVTEDKSDYSSIALLFDKNLGILYENGFGAKEIRYASKSTN